MTIIILFLFNWLNEFYSHSKNKKIEIFDANKNFVSFNNKTMILLLDEMIGYDGIDENLNYGKLAKKSYLDLSKNLI